MSDKSEGLKINDEIKTIIIKDAQIKKFSAYGFLKNLAFFKPYLLLFLMSKGIDLFQIGILYSIREAVIYIFEIPSGLIADYYGRKKELYFCFSFYILSFIVFFFAANFYLAALAMVFFGLGEAFRSGTHKAMILTYLDLKKLKDYKTFVYGRTRSFSLLGSAMNALIAIFLLLCIRNVNYIFLISIVPYVLDFILIATYPDYLDKNLANQKDLKGIEGRLEINTKMSIKIDIKSVIKNKKLRKILFSQAFFLSVKKTCKDMIQPAINNIILVSGIVLISGLSIDKNIKVIIALSYFFINIISSYSSRNAYKLLSFISKEKFMRVSFISLGISLMLLNISLKFSLILSTIFLFLIVNVLSDVRKPVYIDVLDSVCDKKLRATVMSFESQITSISTIIIAPAFGYISERWGLGNSLLVLGLILLIVSIISHRFWR